MAYLHKEPIEPSAATLKNLFVRDPEKGRQQIGELLDLMMEPSHQSLVERKEDLAGWVKALFTTEKSFEDFCAKISVYDKSSLCGCVWTKNFVAYRCKTCATSPCMSICAACFERGNHEGHEFNIFRSEAGGACDCGDASVMDPSGFCERHGLNRVVSEDIPESLLKLPKFIMERILIMFLHNLRYMVRNELLESSFPSKIPDPVCETLDIFLEAIKCGSPVRSWVADFLLSEEYYKSLNENRYFGGIVTEKEKEYHKISIRTLKEASKRLPMCPVPEEIVEKARFSRSSFVYKNLLHEFTFWLCRFEFPEHLILFLLNMLPDERVKEEFSRYFVQHYIYIAPSLVGALRVEDYSNRIVHISVQLFSNSDLACMLAKEEALLEVFMISMNFLVMRKLVNSKTSESDFHQVVQTSGSGLQNNAYWAIVSDFVNCLGHEQVGKLFLQNEPALKVWMKVLACFSGMDILTRLSGRHIEYEPDNILLAFYTEREACAAPLWVMLDVMKDSTTLSHTQKMLLICQDAMIELLDALGVDDSRESKIPFNIISFHYPLHRYFALFASNAISRQGMRVQDMQMDEKLVRKLMAHPMQVICTSYEVQCNMWVRNGMSINTQQLAYRQSFFCTFFLDADLFMLQLCSNFMSPDIFVSSIFDRCRVSNCFTVDAETTPLPERVHGADGQPDEDKLPNMLESALTILLSVLGIRTHLGMTDQEIVEQELVAVLSTQNFTHSHLIEHIPQCHDLHAGERSKRFTEPLTAAIDELAYAIEGDAMTQTEYALKDDNWKRYDPIFTQHRALYKRHVQQAHTNYFKYLQRQNKLSPGVFESDVWPPYRSIRIKDERYVHLNRILNCRTLHTIIFMIIYKFLHQHSVVSEQSLIMAIALLEATLYAAPLGDDQAGSSTAQKSTGDKEPEWKRLLGQWFDSDSMATNIRKVINVVQLPQTEVEIFHEAMETDEQRQNQPETSEAQELPERCVVIEESIITMLLKLYTKYCGRSNSFTFPTEFTPNLEPDDVSVPTPSNVITKILLLAASKSAENQQVIRELCPSTTTVHRAVADEKSRHEAERERRKQKAHEMQQRLLQDFASKQRKFLEQIEVQLDLPPGAVEQESTEMEDEDKYQCVICGSSGDKIITITGTTEKERRTSAKSQIMCLVGLAQSSALLGFRTESDEPRSVVPIDATVAPVNDCRRNNQDLCENLKMKFPSEIGSVTLGHFIDWELSPHVSTCGHHVHVTCHQDYLKWVRQDASGYLGLEDGIGFLCPLCRQTSNVVVPCNIIQERPAPPNELRQKLKPHTPDRSLPQEDQNFLKHLWEVSCAITTNVPIRTRFVPDVSTESSDAQDQGSRIDPIQMKEISVLSSDEILKVCDESVEEILAQNRVILENDASMQLTPRGVLQGQLEYDLCRLGGTLLTENRLPLLSTVKRNLPIGPLFHATVKILRVKGDKPNNDYVQNLWKHLIGEIIKLKDTNNCPLLLKDPVALLIEICVAIYPFSTEEYQAVTRILYNLCLIQSLVHISCNFSPDERSAWKANVSASVGGVPFDASTLDCLLGYVIFCLPHSLFDNSSDVKAFMSPSATQHYTSTVWTSQSVESSISAFCLHFMRLSALLQFHLYENMSAKNSFHTAPEGENEFVYLAKYLGMVDGACAIPKDNISAVFAKWPNQARSIINHWCKEIEVVVRADRQTSFQLLTRHRMWKQPTLAALPEDYTALFSKFRDVTCPRCQEQSNEPCVCLLCGEFVCYKGMCQNRDYYGYKHEPGMKLARQSAAAHAKRCGNGTIVLLHINNTTIIVVRGQRSCIWGTLYLDHHGEEDRGWKRGRRLIMRPQRLKVLQYQWLNHIFDSACNGWRKHRNQM